MIILRELQGLVILPSAVIVLPAMAGLESASGVLDLFTCLVAARRQMPAYGSRQDVVGQVGFFLEAACSKKRGGRAFFVSIHPEKDGAGRAHVRTSNKPSL